MAYKIISLGQEEKIQEPTSLISDIPRQLGGLALRAGEAALGYPADIAQTFGGLISSGLESLTGVQAPSPAKIPLPEAKTRQLIKESKFGRELERIGLPVQTEIELPTTEILRKATRSLTGETFEPQTEIEQQLQEFVSTLTPFLIGGVSPARAISTAGLGQLAKFGAQKINVPKEYQEPIKVGAMLASSFIGIPKIESFAKNLYEQAKSALPEDTTIATQSMLPQIRKIGQKIEGLPFPGKKAVLENLAAIEEAVNPLTKQIQAQKLWDLKKVTNEWLRDPSLRKASTAKQYLAEMSKVLSDTLIKETATQLPEFSQTLKRADDIWRVLRGSQEASTVIGSAINKIKKQLNPVTLVALGYFFPGKTAAFGAFQAGSSVISNIKNIFNNEGVRYYYKKLIESALKNNQSVLIKSLKGFDKEISKQDKFTGQKGYKIISFGS